MKRPPIVLLPACNVERHGHPVHLVGRKYADAVRLAGGLPLAVPRAEPDELDALLDLADGLLLTGSPSNVHPGRFGREVHDATLPLDPTRDAWTLALVPLALERGVPLFAICRGFQEMNVALGGSLHQAVHELPGHADHRDPPGLPVEEAYGPVHDVRVAPGGVLDRLGLGPSIHVNSLHGQGIDRLADGLRVEANADDGLVESFSMPGRPAFNLGVQWHPEWRAADNPVSVRLFTAFGDACRRRAERRGRDLPEPVR